MFLSPFVTQTWFKMWWIKHAQKVPSTKPFMSNGALFPLSPLPPPTSSLMHFTKYWNIETSAHFTEGSRLLPNSRQLSKNKQCVERRWKCGAIHLP